jgi:uncharacterized protein (TIGR02118 family)
MKLLSFIRRREGMTPEEFEHHWRHVHGELVLSHIAAIRCKRYVQTHLAHPEVFSAMNDPRGGPASVAEPYDGVAELWWETADDFLASLESPDGKAAWAEIAADEPNFVNYKTTYNFIGEEVLIWQSPDWAAPE